MAINGITDQPICPACLSKEIGLMYKKIYGLKSLLNCKKCGLWFAWPMSSAVESRQLYDEKYYDAWFPDELGLEGIARMKQATSGRLLAKVSGYIPKGSLLDVGCGFGHLLKVAERLGWDARGVEISERAAGEARKAVGSEKIWTGDFLDVPLPKTAFDVITMVDFIEHVYDVYSVLKKCAESLKVRGLLVIVTPDTDSLSRKFFGTYWPHFNKEHVVYFSRKSIGKVLGLNGFELLETSGFIKALNFYYMRSLFREHRRRLLRYLLESVFFLAPGFIKNHDFFLPHGEMLIIARKR